MSKVKVVSAYVNQGMSYKIITEKTLNKRIAKGAYEGCATNWLRFVRHIGEFPVGYVKDLEDKFGKGAADHTSLIRTRESFLSGKKGKDGDTYFANPDFTHKLFCTGVSTVKYLNENDNPNIFQVIGSIISDIFHWPKHRDSVGFWPKAEDKIPKKV